ncbi:hypothetical protein VTL71DRAFT_1291 [Oculimacula yallundae]|uniref:RING-type domain-containing protein n=1 Tax=Oculimacula yallundae TaxID=86028 RepID=A0ABR4CB27_9HELO
MALILKTDERSFPKTETLFTQCSHIDFVDTGLGKHAPKMGRYSESKCPHCLAAREGAVLADKLADNILQNFSLRLEQLPCLRHGLSSTVTNDPNTFIRDTSKFISPRIRIVPEGASILKKQDKCSICWGIFDPSLDSIKEGCNGGEPVMLPCGHIFGQDCIGEIFSTFSKSCPLCTRAYKIRTLETKYLEQRMFDMFDDQDGGQFLWIARVSTVFCLYPLFVLVDAIMGCGPETKRPKMFWTTFRHVGGLFWMQFGWVTAIVSWSLVSGKVMADILLPGAVFLLERVDHYLYSLLLVMKMI